MKRVSNDDAVDFELDGDLDEPPRGYGRYTKKVCVQCGSELGRAATCPVCGFSKEDRSLGERSLTQHEGDADEMHLDPPRPPFGSDPDDPMSA